MQDLISKHASRLELSMRLMDVAALWAAGHLAGLVRFSGPLANAAPIHSVLLLLCCAMAYLLFFELGLYLSWRGRSVLTMFGRVTASWGLVLLIGLFISFLMHHVGELSRLWLFYWFLAGSVFIVAVRWIVYSSLRYLRRNGVNSKTVVIVGYGQIGQEMHKRAQQQDWYGYEVQAICADPEDAQYVDTNFITRIGTLEELPAYVIEHQIDEIWIAVSVSSSAKLQRLQYLLRNALVDIRWVPDTLGMQMLSNKIGDFMGFPAVDLNRPVSSGLNGLAKDLFDKLFALAVLILLAPLFSVIAICIKVSSPGPVFFKQPRLGLNGKKFDVYKFRSMKLHHESGIVKQATKSDPRITRIGQFIRRTSLDELPQFFNVLLGDMSIVGPRPHALQHNEMYSDLLEVYMARHRVKPGITGWAQINGYRGETDTVDKMARRVQCDLYYIQHWSLWMDMRIIVWTAFKGWTGNNAY
ncbi:MAG: undecaprenyl-phosphate glucose phosphotransferase [Pseudomonadota bacterium]